MEDICAGFDIPPEGAVITGFYRSNLTLYITPVTVADRDATLQQRLSSRSAVPGYRCHAGLPRHRVGYAG